MTAIEYSTEKLTHFRCGHCQQWWAIGDWKKAPGLYCPSCGRYQTVKKLKQPT